MHSVRGLRPLSGSCQNNLVCNFTMTPPPPFPSPSHLSYPSGNRHSCMPGSVQFTSKVAALLSSSHCFRSGCWRQQVVHLSNAGYDLSVFCALQRCMCGCSRWDSASRDLAKDTTEL